MSSKLDPTNPLFIMGLVGAVVFGIYLYTSHSVDREEVDALGNDESPGDRLRQQILLKKQYDS